MLTIGNFPLEVGAFIALSLEMRSERMDNFTVVNAIVRGTLNLILVSLTKGGNKRRAQPPGRPIFGVSSHGI